MKTRTDFVSNSSSSSFIILGNKVDTSKGFFIDNFSNLPAGDAFFIVLNDAGSEGDYIFPLTPQTLMDFDLRQMDVSNLTVIHGNMYIPEGGSPIPAEKYSLDEYAYGYSEERKTLKTSGIAIPSGARIFRFFRDYGNPRSISEMYEET